MKKFIVIIATLLISSVSMANIPLLPISFGLKAGYSTTNLSTNRDSIMSGFRNNLTYGLFVRLDLHRIYIQPELMVFNVESNYRDINLSDVVQQSADVTFSSVNFQVPVMIGYKIMDAKIFNVRIQAGPTLNYAINDVTISQEEGQTSEVKFDPTTISWACQAGLGIDVLGFLTLDIKYNFGLTEVTQKLQMDVDLSTVNLSTEQLNQFSVTVGLKL